jgi:coenzyme F420 hydrogenase subunit beta
METTTGEVRQLTYHDMWPDEDETNLRLQSRCKICPDDLGDGADIVAADCWDGGVPTGEDEGFNAILVHTERGLKLYEAAVAAGALTVSRSIGFAEMDSFHPYHLNKKRAALPRLLGMRLAGLPTPRTSRLRLASLALRQSPRSFLREAYGAYRRARAGRLGEGAPVPERDRAGQT